MGQWEIRSPVRKVMNIVCDPALPDILAPLLIITKVTTTTSFPQVTTPNSPLDANSNIG